MGSNLVQILARYIATETLATIHTITTESGDPIKEEALRNAVAFELMVDIDTKRTLAQAIREVGLAPEAVEPTTPKKKRKFSAAARKKMSEAMKKRWAQKRLHKAGTKSHRLKPVLIKKAS